MKPEPISKHIVCSVCGLPWEDHKQTSAPSGRGEYKPSLEDCVRLLKAKLGRLRWQPHGIYSGTMGGSFVNADAVGRDIPARTI